MELYFLGFAISADSHNQKRKITAIKAIHGIQRMEKRIFVRLLKIDLAWRPSAR
jgi:hypothetical protein